MRIDWQTLKQKWTVPPKGTFPTGSRVYKGYQGSGKTLSMVKYTLDILKTFPDCVIFSNIRIFGLPELQYEYRFDEKLKIPYYVKNSGTYKFIDDDEILQHALAFRNGERGVLVLLDEAHLYFNKKNGISLDVLTAISQQRKDRKRLVFSSQIWEELDISLRKQVKEIVSCRCFLRHFQYNTVYDGETLCYQHNLDGTSGYNAKKMYSDFFKHYDELYFKYDTYQKIITNKDYSRSPSSSPQPLDISISSNKQPLQTRKQIISI